MSDKKRSPQRWTARRTAGEGVPKRRRDGPAPPELKAEPERLRRRPTARLSLATRSARDREGL